MKFTFKISYSAMGEAPFQTNTHLSLKKKKKKKRNTIPYKSKQPFIHGTKEPKKKKREAKNPSDNTRLSIKKKKKTERNAVLF